MREAERGVLSDSKRPLGLKTTDGRWRSESSELGLQFERRRALVSSAFFSGKRPTRLRAGAETPGAESFGLGWSRDFLFPQPRFVSAWRSMGGWARDRAAVLEAASSGRGLRQGGASWQAGLNSLGLARAES